MNNKMHDEQHQEYIIYKESIQRPYRSLLHERVFAQSHIPLYVRIPFQLKIIHHVIMGGVTIDNTCALVQSSATSMMALSSAVPLSSLLSTSFILLEEIAKFLESQDIFGVTWCTYNEQSCLVLHHKQLYPHPPNPTSRCKIYITINGHYMVHILLREVESGSILYSPLEYVQKLITKYSPFSNAFKFCPGFAANKYHEYQEIIRFDIKGVCKMTNPFSRIDSKTCEMWHELPKNTSMTKREAEELLCRQSIRLKCNLERQVRRTNEESPSKKLKRQCATSRARLTHVTKQPNEEKG